MSDKLPQKWRGQGPEAEFFKIQNPFRKFGTSEAKNFKFSTPIVHLKHDKIPQKGVVRVQGPKMNFKLSSVNLERVKLETSNLVYR